MRHHESATGRSEQRKLPTAFTPLAGGTLAFIAAFLLLGFLTSCGVEPAPGLGSETEITVTEPTLELTTPTAPAVPETPSASDTGPDEVGLEEEWCSWLPESGVSGCVADETCGWDEMYLTDIRVGLHDGFDRVVFDLAGDALPCYWVYFEDEPLQDGSGFPVDLEGFNAIRVKIPRLGPEFPTVSHGFTANLSGPAVAFARFDTFFEGTATSFIAVTGSVADFEVSRLPGQLIIDVKHP
jgi:hypothetical protein